MRKVVLLAVLAIGALALVAATALAGGSNGGGHHKASLNSYEEVVGGPGATSTGSVSTTGRGRLSLRIEDDGIRFRLRYQNTEGGTVTQAHIHFAQRHVSGGVIAFLCGGTTEAPCTTPSGDISGTITPAEIIGPADQGIPAGAAGFAEAVKAIRVGATYANVHTSPSFPEGEIRGQIGRGNGKGHGRDR